MFRASRAKAHEASSRAEEEAEPERTAALRGAPSRPRPPVPLPRSTLADPAHERSVWRYFDLADCFVQILLVDESALRLADRPGINRAGYRRLVIDACMPEFRGDVESAIEPSANAISTT